jgi:teichoic acid transport system permease protein
MQYNPVHIFIQLVRHGLLDMSAEEKASELSIVTMWGMGALWGVGLMLVGFLYFWRAEERYGRE